MRKFYFHTLGKKVGIRLDENVHGPKVGKVTAIDDGAKVDLWLDVVLCRSWIDMRRQKNECGKKGFYKCFVKKQLAVYVNGESPEVLCALRQAQCVDNALEGAVARVFFALQAELKVMLLHASCVEKEGKAYVFVAPSGGGKTTLSKRMEKSGYRIISEECCPICFADGKFLAGPRPSFLESDKEKLYEVAGMYVLEKAEEDSIESISVNEAMAKAFPETMVHYFGFVPDERKKRCREQTFSLLEKVFNSIPFGMFRFTREGAVNICV